MSRVIVYSTDPCPYCLQAKALLNKRGIDFEEITLGRDPAGRDELIEKTGFYTFPQVIIDGTVVGGYTELKAAYKSGKLDELLADAA
jgi:glutaredoxin 3